MTNQEQYELIWEKAKKYDKLVDVLDKIRAELKQYNENPANYPVDMIKIADVLQIIDKYRTSSNEAQTNEIVYDIGGHMYGVMGGDVIMDILAGKGKQ